MGNIYDMIPMVSAEPYFEAAAQVLANRVPRTAPADMLNALTAFQRLGMPLGPLLGAAQHITMQHMASCSTPEMCAYFTSLAEVWLTSILVD